MASGLRQLIAPAYLLLCLLIGGSAQGIWGNMILQLTGLALIAWAAMSRDDERIVEPARQLLWIAILALGVVALQLMPIPPSIWPHTGGRERIADGYRVLGLALSALPSSLTPYKTLDSMLGLIPPLAVFCAIVRLKAYRGSFMAVALIAGAIAGILLGALQVSSSVPTQSPESCSAPFKSRAPFRPSRRGISTPRPTQAMRSVSSQTPTTWRPCSSSHCRFSPRSRPLQKARRSNAIRHSSYSPPRPAS